MPTSDPSQPQPPQRATLGKAIGRIPSGVFVLTAANDPPGPYPLAMLVSWVQQVGFQPPALSLALAKDRPIRGALEASGRFALSVLAQGDSALLKKYARGFAPDANPFDGVPTRQTPAGLPVLSDALGWFDCRLMGVYDFQGDHHLFVAEITDGGVLKDGSPFTHVRGNGFHY